MYNLIVKTEIQKEGKMKPNEVIVFLREREEITQRELAKSVGINISVMNRIESGERPLRDDEIIKIAKYFNVSIDYLLGNVVYDHNPSMYPFDPKEQSRKGVSDPELIGMINAAHKDPELRILFNASKKLKKEDLQTVINLVKAMKTENDQE